MALQVILSSYCCSIGTAVWQEMNSLCNTFIFRYSSINSGVACSLPFSKCYASQIPVLQHRHHRLIVDFIGLIGVRGEGVVGYAIPQGLLFGWRWYCLVPAMGYTSAYNASAAATSPRAGGNSLTSPHGTRPIHNIINHVNAPTKAF